MCFSRCYTAHDRKIAHLFGRYGRLIARHPWVFIICSIVLSLLLGIGLIRLEFEHDLETQYLPENNKASKDRQFLMSMFKPDDNDNFQIHSLADVGYFAETIISSKNGENILDGNAYQEIVQIYNLITKKIKISPQATTEFTYKHLCATNRRTCVVFGAELLAQDFPQNLRSGNVTYPLYKSAILLSPMLGKVVVKNDRLLSAEMVKMRYYLQDNPESQEQLSEAWIKEFSRVMGELRTNVTEVAYTYHNALDDEVASSSMAEAHLFIITVGLMVTYASIITAGRRINCVYDRQNLGRVGVFCAILSMVPAAGIASACGVKFMNSVGIMPFLIVGKSLSLPQTRH